MSVVESVISRYNLSDAFCSFETNKEGEVIALDLFDADYDDFPIDDTLIPEFITHFKQLKHLNIDLVNNQIKDLEILKELKHLESIFIECNTKISDVSFTQSLPKLKQLYIQSSLISQIDCLVHNTALEHIGLPNAQIADISVLSDLTRLKSIDFSNNLIEEVKGGQYIKYLNSINLSHNKLKHIKGLDICIQLNHIHLGHNQISDLSPITHPEEIKHLTAHNNRIKDFSMLKSSTQLGRLSIASNLVESIDFIKDKQRLEYLNISNNPIGSIHVLGHLKSLNHLVASHLQNLRIPEGVEFRAELKYLDLSYCDLSSVSFLSNQKNLLRLNLANNHINDLEFLKHIEGLKHINLNNNGISVQFPIYYFFKPDAIDLRNNTFGNVLFEKYEGAAHHASGLYNLDRKEVEPKFGLISDLQKMLADYAFKNGKWDEALAFYYINKGRHTETIFNIYLNKLCETPSNEVVYIKYYFKKVLENLTYNGDKNRPQDIYDRILKVFKGIEHTSQRAYLIKVLEDVMYAVSHHNAFRFSFYEFYFYENKVVNPVLSDEILYLKGIGFWSDRVKRDHLSESIYYLKELYKRNSPFFYALKYQILDTLDMHFAYTAQERKLHDYYKGLVKNIAVSNIKKTIEDIDLVKLGLHVEQGYNFVYYDQELVRKLYKPNTVRKVELIEKSVEVLGHNKKQILYYVLWGIFILYFLVKLLSY